MGKGMRFSQALMTTSSELITRRYGNEGYTFAKVEGYPELNKEDNTAKVTFVLMPGMRAYVRRIEFRGNTKTEDEVLRREMRQMEGSSANNALIESSKVRLERLGFFKEVSVENTSLFPGLMTRSMWSIRWKSNPLDPLAPVLVMRRVMAQFWVPIFLKIISLAREDSFLWASIAVPTKNR